MNDEVFNDIKKMLISENEIEGIDAEYMCPLVALYDQNILLEENVKSLFLANLYKYNNVGGYHPIRQH